MLCLNELGDFKELQGRIISFSCVYYRQGFYLVLNEGSPGGRVQANLSKEEEECKVIHMTRRDGQGYAGIIANP